jgi:hypothetical protein
MAPTQMQDGEFGRLRVAFDDEIQYYALAPEATLGDVSVIFAAASSPDCRRLRSVVVTIVTEPQLTSDDATETCMCKS